MWSDLCLYRPPFYILQRFKLQLDENSQRRKAELTMEKRDKKRRAANAAWSKLRAFVKSEWANLPTPEEKSLWMRENSLYYSKMMDHANFARDFHHRRELYEKRSSGHEELTPEDKVLAKLYHSFWSRSKPMSRMPSFRTIVTHAQEKHVCHAKRTNRALGMSLGLRSGVRVALGDRQASGR